MHAQALNKINRKNAEPIYNIKRVLPIKDY